MLSLDAVTAVPPLIGITFWHNFNILPPREFSRNHLWKGEYNDAGPFPGLNGPLLA